jgi:ribonuclease D
MQISNREQDWVVDCLALRNHVGPALAPLFADPSVVKVGPYVIAFWVPESHSTHT